MEDILIRVSDEGEISVFDSRDDFMASFRNGKWVNDLLFNSYELEEFTIIEDEGQIQRVMSDARAELNRPFEAGKSKSHNGEIVPTEVPQK